MRLIRECRYGKTEEKHDNYDLSSSRLCRYKVKTTADGFK